MQKLIWQQELKNAITDPIELLKLLSIEPKSCLDLLTAAKNFPLLVPQGFVARMQKNNLNDPLLSQILPLRKEEKIVPGFCKDPLDENSVNPVPGLLHKYHGRVLITITGKCAVNCRFCFRRYFPFQKNNLALKQILNYIANDKSIYEVILSGGEPLIENDKNLKHITKKIAAIKHAKYLRIHSRMPIVIPSRITDEFIQWFTGTRLQPIMVIHCNHPNEIDKDVHSALRRLKKVGVTLLNQSVLLKDINDSTDTLIELSEKIFNIGVLPYYLHLLDKVQGATHFAVDKKVAQLLITEMMKRLPGYLVPKLVYEKANILYKIPISSLSFFQ